MNQSLLTTTKNQWQTFSNPCASWEADLTSAASSVPALLDWLTTVLEAGEASGIYTVHRSLRAGDFRRERNGAFAPWVRTLAERTGAVPLFDFDSLAPVAPQTWSVPRDAPVYVATTRLAYFDKSGAVVEDDITDPADLLESLRPGLARIAPGVLRGHRPLFFSGARLETRAPEQSQWRFRQGELRIGLHLHTDLWFPVVRGIEDEDEVWDDDPLFDNRPLAARHTPRLNQFLKAIANAARTLGGTWTIDEEFTRADLRPYITEQGVTYELPDDLSARALRREVAQTLGNILSKQQP